MSPQRKQLIETARMHRNAWLKEARILREDGFIPGFAMNEAFRWHRHFMMILCSRKR